MDFFAATIGKIGPYAYIAVMSENDPTRTFGDSYIGQTFYTATCNKNIPGEPVVVEILRNARPMQLVVPRGPLGIIGSLNRPVQDMPVEE